MIGELKKSHRRGPLLKTSRIRVDRINHMKNESPIKLIEGSQNQIVGFDQAASKIQTRPWLIDNCDDVIEKLLSTATYHCVAIFVDNSGADVIFGIIPLARELARNKTKVSEISVKLVQNKDQRKMDISSKSKS